MSVLRELKKKSAFIFIGNVVGKIITSISIIIIGRILGAEIYGQFIFVTSFLLLFTVIPKFGFENGIVYFLSKSSYPSDTKKSILSFCLLITLILSMIIVLVSYINNGIIHTKLLNGIYYKELYLLLLPSIVLDSFKALLNSSLKALRKVKVITILDNLFSPINKTMLVVVLVFFFDIKSYYSLIIPLYLNHLISISYILYKLKNYNLLGFKIIKFDKIRIITYSLPLLFAGLVSVLNQTVDSYMIGFMLGAKEVGIYKVAFQFGTISVIALTSIDTIFAPIISSLYHENKIKDLSMMYRLTTKWVTIINLLIFGIIIIFTKDIMNIPGEEFLTGASALIIIAAGQVINSITGSVGSILNMIGRPKYNLISDLTGVILNVFVNLILIIPFGINGAAIGTSFALLTRNLMKFIFVYKSLKIIPYDRSYYKIIGIFIITVISVFSLADYIHLNYFFRILIGGTIYFALFMLLMFKFVLRDYNLNNLKTLYFGMSPNN
jgi:O-antigen/teichoic acid export membrane protein